MSAWSPTSWQAKPAAQQPNYPSEAEAAQVIQVLSNLPPLVTSWEIEALRSQLAEAARGEMFLLQGGDCAESFDACDSSTIANKLKILLQMSLVLVHGGKRRVTRVGRIAGQYAKPRSSEYETINGVTLPSYRGDLINRPDFAEADRTPDPQLMLRGYERAALTLNFIRALVQGGFADLHHPEYWDLDFVAHSPLADEYRHMVESIRQGPRFMEHILGGGASEMERVDFFTSHEALHLPYEGAQTRRVPRHEGWYNLSTHFPWIGMRTADPGGAHVECLRGIRNPIGVKIGPDKTPRALVELLEILHPDDEPGRLTLIHRFGAGKIAARLPPLVEAVGSTGKTVLWCCDPMHGNTQTLSNGVKTCRFEDILAELEQAFEIHAGLGSHLGGVHFELTGENVTECTGGARGLSEADLNQAYLSRVDPRLNYEQALEMAMMVARKMSRLKARKSSSTRHN